ncbi:MAG: tRNA preQ1(34) S-adenosylmethionine ribosyltransferase-isomerase QueA [Pyrinomonadaceae bacterium]|nr:tRNA preQ1(34) S-adenosylmethionine ribosyltransferase-isomerase QueA [Pyrinomonadaceae bacterium]
MLISDFDFDLPENLIAQEPLEHRDESKMLIVNRARNDFQDNTFHDFPIFVNENDTVVLNNTKVFPARLIGNREGFDGRIELFLVREIENGFWESLARPAKRLRIGEKIIFGNGKLRAKVLEKTEEGRVVVSFESESDFSQVIEEIGQTPLPPYIRRGEKPKDADRERYQTVFAKNRGAIAAPTAGLHFTPDVLRQITERGARIAEITLHVGYGTFEPVKVENLDEHKVAPEQFFINEETAEIINSTRGKVIAIGTTTTRALESASIANRKIAVSKSFANLTITNGYKFKTVDALLTNFHLPRSSLLVLVSTFAGHELIFNAYRHAVVNDYRFYSYGDCMFIV